VNLKIYNHLGVFYVTCFARVCEIFTAVVSASQCGAHIVLKVFMRPHMLYRRSVFVCCFFLNTE